MKQVLNKLSLLILILSVLFIPTRVQATNQEFAGQKVKVGVVGESSEKVWKFVKEQAKEKEGIDIEVVLFTDYVLPNKALADGSIDLNAFQHIAFLDNWNKQNNEELQVLGHTLITKLGLYSDKHKTIADIPEGATIAIPNDATNGGRALLALQIAGLIKVNPDAGILPTVKDITENPKNIKITELEAGQLAISLKDVDAAFINSGHASNAGLSTKDAIFVDTSDLASVNKAYRNVIVSRKEDQDKPLFKKIVELYQTDEVAKKIVEYDNGGSVPAWDGAPQVQD